MTTYGWTNDAGEPIMDGAAYRFEQQLDMESAADYYTDHFYDDDGESPCYDNQELCSGGDLDYLNDEHGECSWCGRVWDYNWND